MTLALTEGQTGAIEHYAQLQQSHKVLLKQFSKLLKLVGMVNLISSLS